MKVDGKRLESSATRAIACVAMLALCACGHIKLFPPESYPPKSVVPVHADAGSPVPDSINEHAILGSDTPVYKNGVDGGNLLGRHNELATDYYRREESAFYPCVRNGTCVSKDSTRWPSNLPRFCVAMSGGGIRSAAFNVGVLQGLQSRRVLDKVDITSSVSGGSYANYWFFGSMLSAPSGLATQDLLLDDSRYIKHISQRGFINRGWVLWTAFWGMIGNVVRPLERLLLPSTGVSLAHGLSTIAYSAPIELTFNGVDKRWWEISPRMADVKRQLGLHEPIPFPIINATARAESWGRCGASGRLFDTAFEVTPLRMGSEGIGYTSYFPHAGIAQVVAISGAASDDPDSRLCQLKYVLGLRLGMWLDFPRTASRVTRVGNDAERLSRSEVRTAPPVYVSDGGFADNLGMYPLVKRLCQSIVVVDAEHDPHLLFTGYRKLQKRLHDEMGAVLHVPGVERQIDNAIGDLGIDIRASYDSKRLAQVVEQRENGYFRANALQRPVMEGHIGEFPFAGKSPLKIRVVYVKLAADDQILEDVHLPFVSGHYAAEQQRYKKVDEAYKCRKTLLGVNVCPFPQASTARQQYSFVEFSAYRELGRALVERFFPLAASEEVVTEAP